MKYIFILFLFCIVLYSCKSNNPVTPENNTVPANYTKIDSVQSGNWKFVMFSATSQTLNYGYNDIGFKVYNNGAEMNSGYVKYTPVMIRPGVSGYSSPVKSSFNYNSDAGIFTGYVCFTMYSDTNSFWKGCYDYNGVEKIDSIPFTVLYQLYDNIRVWTDNSSGHTFVLSLIKPLAPSVGLNDISFMLHRTDDEINYSEVDNAGMVIYPYMVGHGHTSSGNINPTSSGGGLYEGKVNFTMNSKWNVYDTIRVSGTIVTNNNPPYFNFAVH